ncbi:MAG TPA: LD-carboxypeptidase [Bacteroidales bacterium]|nr:LD-carboxypeptidase [Bacteroidales bacterium]
MVKPEYLKKGDTVCIVSPAGKIEHRLVEQAVKTLQFAGFKTQCYPHVFDEYHQFAGTDRNRLDDFQQAISNTEAKCILCSRGGYGAIRISEKIDLSPLNQYPKWLLGFSDITMFHCLFHNKGFQSVHAPMAKGLAEKDSIAVINLMNLLKGKGLTYRLGPEPMNRFGRAEAPIIGGNLSVLYSLLGTPYFPDLQGKILFIEDLNEYHYHLDRMMHSLRLSMNLEGLAGVIVGAFTGMLDNKTPFGKSTHEIIAEHLQYYNFPVCYNFPAGHIDDNRPLLFGSECKLNVTASYTELQF